MLNRGASIEDVLEREAGISVLSISIEAAYQSQESTGQSALAVYPVGRLTQLN